MNATTQQKLDEALRAISEINELLADWPTMRALSSLGAQKATANKIAARGIIANVLTSVGAECAA